MQARIFFIFSMLLFGCSAPPRFELPENVADWKRVASAKEGATASARYTGVPEISVSVTRKGSTTEAFNDLQSWRAEAGKLAFYRGPYFGLAESPGADQKTLSRFVRALEARIPDR